MINYQYFMEKNKGMKILIGLFFLSFIADLVSTLKVGKLIELLEANPLYSFGGLVIPILFNIIVVGWCYIWYRKTKKPFYRFFFISYLVSVIILRVGITISNLRVAELATDPVFVETVKQTSTEVLTQMKQIQLYQMFLSFIVYFVNPLLSFMFFKMDHNIELKEMKDENNKRLEENNL